MRRWLPLLILPLLLLLTWRFALSAKAPYYHRSHSDPEYAYLLNSLNILNGNPPGHYDHPGTTVQLIGAGVVSLQHAFVRPSSPSEPVTMSVLRNPESYLNGINVCLAALFLLAVVVLSIRIAGLAGTVAALCFQLGLFTFFQISVAMTRVSPEPLLLTATLVVATIVMPTMLGRSECSRGQAIALGVTCGFGIATKVVFLPICLSIFLLKDARKRLLCLLATLAGFVIFTLPIFVHYRAFLDWILNLATHDGHFGLGEKGIPSTAVLIQNGVNLLEAEPFLFVSFVLCAFVALLRLLRREPARPFVVGCAILALQWLITAKHPSPHYLLPSLSFGAVLVSVAYDALHRIRGAATLAVFLLMLGAGVWTTVMKGQAWIAHERSSVANMASVQKELAARSCKVVSYYGSSALSYALAFGNDYSSNCYAGRLEGLYQGELFYNIWRRSFYSFKGPVAASEIRADLPSRCYLLYGGGLEGGPYGEGLDIVRVVTAGDEVLYSLKGLTIP
jgi:hypothetical protein